MEEVIKSELPALSGLSFTELKKIKTTSDSIKLLGYFWCVAAAFFIAALLYSIASKEMAENISFLFSFFALTAGATAFGLMHREDWGRIVGIIASFIILLGFPLGTVLGAMGLITLLNAEQFFGASAWSHEDILKEFKSKQP